MVKTTTFKPVQILKIHDTEGVVSDRPIVSIPSTLGSRKTVHASQLASVDVDGSSMLKRAPSALGYQETRVHGMLNGHTCM
jgi:hypothetical protein